MPTYATAAPKLGKCFRTCVDERAIILILYIIAFALTCVCISIAFGDGLFYKFFDPQTASAVAGCSSSQYGKRSVLFLRLNEYISSFVIESELNCIIAQPKELATAFNETSNSNHHIIGGFAITNLLLLLGLCGFGIADYLGRLEYDNPQGRVTILCLNVLALILSSVGALIVSAGSSQTCANLPPDGCYLESCQADQHYCCSIDLSCAITATKFNATDFTTALGEANKLEGCFWGCVASSVLVLLSYWSTFANGRSWDEKHRQVQETELEKLTKW